MRVKNENGEDLKVNNLTGTLLTKEPIELPSGEKAFVYQNTN
jgi:hypothetical protein